MKGYDFDMSVRAIRGAIQVEANTAEAIATGCLEAACGAIRGMMRRLPSQAQCLITGGDAATLSAQLDIAHQRVDNLVLDGLALLAQAS